MSAIDFPDDLLALERAAWEAQQAGTLTADQAADVQIAVTKYAAEHGLDRYEVEMALKRAVRHTEG
ncbi:hypothetical protein [Streptomyces sp. SID8499]|uniref:hypothetical protein n=1 Tax=Streptomyces sp. SID8499 TaxID=2706106 RepID=UPI0013C870C5|nr:hypothetical protein [Streptomyces sp. SID8499]NED31144.1 hypothetical protein [Streptomyces sp. SID8499]